MESFQKHSWFYKLMTGCLAFVPVWLLWRFLFKKKGISLRDKVVLITGASSGLGKACAEVFYRRGAKIILCSRRETELEIVKNQLLSLQVDNQHIPQILCLDLEKIHEIPKTISKVVASNRNIDILVNNAGISYRGVAMDTDIDVDMKVMTVNYFGQVAITKAILPHMLSQGGGHIVTVSSVQGKISIPHRSAYSASKHALDAFFDCLRAEVSSHNIHVFVINPGYIQTNLSINAVTAAGKQHGVMDSTTATGMKAEYVANCIVHMIESKQDELLLCPLHHKIAILLRVLMPSVYMRIMKARAAK